jgi:hypothetical protein
LAMVWALALAMVWVLALVLVLVSVLGFHDLAATSVCLPELSIASRSTLGALPAKPRFHQVGRR